MESEPFISYEAPPSPSNKRVLLRLYTSHFLSTWNSRMFEFGAVVFLASIFPGTLLYASVYALIRSLFAVLFSSWLGSVVDRLDRLSAIRHSISMHLNLEYFVTDEDSMAACPSRSVLRLSRRSLDVPACSSIMDALRRISSARGCREASSDGEYGFCREGLGMFLLLLRRCY